MAEVPYPLTAITIEDLKLQIWNLIRPLYEDDAFSAINQGGMKVTPSAAELNQLDPIVGFTSLVVANGGTIGQVAGPLLTFDDTNNYLEIMGCSVGIGTATPISKLHIVDNSASVRSQIIEQAGAGDASTQYSLTGLINWIEGIDNSDSYKFKICTSNTLGTNDRFVIDINGNVDIIAHNASTVGLKLGGALVTEGIADSGGAGYKLLRVDN